ncbi:MAG TPA: serine protein kinase, partial [Acetivibrio sp.]|nr:serine protein kinase [Acetivibrio sp.]
ILRKTKISEENESILRESKFDAHIAPHTIEIASMFAILTRLAPSNKVDPITKLKIYNGEEVIEKGMTRKIDIFELREEAPREGMTGISTRFIMKSLDTALSESVHNCINPISVLETLVKAVKELSIGEEERERYLRFLQDTVRKEYNKILEKEITKAFIHGYREQAESLFNNYLDHAEAFVNKTKIKDRNTGEELEPDEKFLRSIEEQIGITDTAATGFRADVTAYMFYVLRNGGKLDYTSYEPLKEAIEKKLMASVKDISRVITQAKVRDQEQSEKYDSMVEEMKRNGYCDNCCNVILKYAANNLWKD